jgi:hypothetical protein
MLAGPRGPLSLALRVRMLSWVHSECMHKDTNDRATKMALTPRVRVLVSRV